jgi:hypothetical protein
VRLYSKHIKADRLPISLEAEEMTNGRHYDQPAIYQIRVKGILDAQWTDWFNGLTIHPQPNAETLLTGMVADQAALHGLLDKLRDLGLPLLEVRRLENHIW